MKQSAVPIRAALRNGAALLVVGLLGAAALLARAWAQPPQAGDDPFHSAADDRPLLILEQFSAEVTRNGLPLQTLKADWAQYDESDELLTLRRANCQIYSKGEPKGRVECGYARTWLQDNPALNVHRHDLEMMDKVTYRMNDGWTMEVPQMRYLARTEVLQSDQPYIKQLPVKNGYMIGRGDGFTMQLNFKEGTFVKWTEYGKPAVLEHSKTPVLQP